MISPRATFTRMLLGFIVAKRAGIEQAVGLRRPLAADHHDVAFGQQAVEIRGVADFAEPLGQRLVQDSLTAGADNLHAKRRAQAPDLLPDAAGADDADGFAIQQQRPVKPRCQTRPCPVRQQRDTGPWRRAVCPPRRIPRSPVNWPTRGRSLLSRRCPTGRPRSRLLAPAGPLMEPFQPRRPGAQVERKRPAAQDDVGFGQQPVAVVAGTPAGGVGAR